VLSSRVDAATVSESSALADSGAAARSRKRRWTAAISRARSTERWMLCTVTSISRLSKSRFLDVGVLEGGVDLVELGAAADLLGQ
jgi:hypothetical protein